jgi:hypothetical protein
MPDRPPQDIKRTSDGISLPTLALIFLVVGFIAGTLLFHVTNTTRKLIWIDAKLNRIERLLKENQK